MDYSRENNGSRDRCAWSWPAPQQCMSTGKSAVLVFPVISWHVDSIYVMLATCTNVAIPRASMRVGMLGCWDGGWRAVEWGMGQQDNRTTGQQQQQARLNSTVHS